jgi:Coenzyme PQQ synthesis protein D (PqqD)
MKVASNVRAMVSSEGGALRDNKRGGTFGLNPVGARIWQFLQQGLSREEIVARIAEQFQMSPEIVGKDVDDFLSALEAHALVRRD